MDFTTLFQLFFIAMGIYSIVLIIKLSRNPDLTPLKFFMPSDIDLKACKDPRGFIAAIRTSLLLVGVVLIVSGGISVVLSNMENGPVFIGFISDLAAIAAMVYYIIVQKNAIKKFWEF